MSRSIRITTSEGNEIELSVLHERLYFHIKESGASEYHNNECDFSLTQFELDAIMAIMKNVRDELKD